MSSNKQAIKTSTAEAAGRKVDKMFDNAAKPKQKVRGKMPKRAQAVKNEGLGRRKSDKKSRMVKLKSHFKAILGGRSGLAQGKK